ncbi:helix-turn-helix domain-containing protein [Sphingobacterium spiritivorum]|uniref:helix-turn-helix domain-containing protein n=1 Tax=Sphingobacterium spiritivorum TaxID=258 RepID=UPI003DA1DAB5
MKKIRFTLLLLIVLYIAIPLRAQDNAAFDSVYNKVYGAMIASDVRKANFLADSLLSIAHKGEEQIKSLMLLANIKHSTGDFTAALVNAIRAQQIAKDFDYLEWTVRTSGFIATTFRNVGLVEEGRKHLAEAEKANKKLKGKEGYDLTSANIYQERAFYYLENKKYKEAIKELENGMQHLKQIPSSPRAIIVHATNDQLLGICYLETNDLQKAREYLNSSLQKLGEQESNLRPYIFRAMGEVEMRLKQYAKAYSYFKQAEAYIASSERAELKSLVYESFAAYYKATNDQSKAVEYSERYMEEIRKKNDLTLKISNQLIKEFYNTQHTESRNKKYLILLSVFLFIVTTVSVIFYIWNRKMQNMRYNHILRDVAQFGLRGNRPEVVQPAKAESRDLRITKETEERILSDLIQLEEQSYFVNKEMSLSAVAARLNTNTNYLSYIINTYRGKDFSHYINEYRVRHIIQRLQEEPKLRHCKLSHIADLAGFSSHSKFSAVFKVVTGIPPSVLISRLREESK